MFQNLSNRFQNVFRRLRGYGVLTAGHLAEANGEIRRALLEADVHHTVVDRFLVELQDEAVGEEIHKALAPAEQYLLVVQRSLVRMLGESTVPLTFGGRSPAVLLCVGLQGSGKTTTVAKLAHWCQREGRRPLMVPADLTRPAAIAQLQTLGREWGLAVAPADAGSPVDVARGALEQARRELYDTVLIDTAGRLHIDATLMTELRSLQEAVDPTHGILVIDAMAGQQGVEVARGFATTVPLTGMIVTKADGDARGGVLLSCARLLHLPVHFLGMGEKVDALERFHPERMASRLLDLGDLASLVERVEAVTDRETALERVKKLAHGRLTLEDFREQLKEMGKMGQLEGLLKMLPGTGRFLPKIDMDRVQRDIRKKEAIINSMTVEERANARILNGSRRKRIAGGSGTSVADVNRLIKEFEMMQKMVKKGARRRGSGLPPEMMQWLGR